MTVNVRKLAVLLAVAVFAAAALADDPQIKCTGTVADAGGIPIPGARVVAYELVNVDRVVRASVASETKSDPAGKFTLTAVAMREGRGALGVFATADGFAADWDDWKRDGAEFKLILEKPLALGGIVVDEAQNRVSGATVQAFLVVGDLPRPHWLPGLAPVSPFIATTDAEGRFLFDRVPPKATATFITTAPGRARIITSNWQSSDDVRGEFAAGNTEIIIELPPEARVSGKVVDSTTGAAAAGMRIVCRKKDSALAYEPVETATGPDGAFSVGGLLDGVYFLQPTPAPPSTLVAAAARVEATAGSSADAGTISLGQPVEFEVTVADGTSKLPLALAGVEISEPEGVMTQTDESGIARITLAPGTHKLSRAYKYGYRNAELARPFQVGGGAPNSMAVELELLPAIRGVVRDEAGNPVAGMSVEVVPLGAEEDVYTDEDGRFAVQWEPDSWGGNPPEAFALLRDEDGMLAAAVEVLSPDMPLDLVARPAASIAVRIVDSDGKPLAGAPVFAAVDFGDIGMTIDKTTTFTDEAGRAEWRALPIGLDYVVTTTMAEYGRRSATLALAPADAGTTHEVELRLSPANLSLSGIVLDPAGKPVSGASVTARGTDQPIRSAKTDETGKFAITGLIAGSVRLQAYARAQDLVGSADAKAGDIDVKIEATPRPVVTSGPVIPETPSLVGKMLPDVESIGLRQAVDSAAGKNLLICFFDLNQRASRHVMKGLVADRANIEAKGVSLIGIDTSGMPDAERGEILQTEGVWFPVGKCGEAEVSAWRAAAMPWLILTDTGHVVRAEGFTANQLDDALAGKIGSYKAPGAGRPGVSW